MKFEMLAFLIGGCLLNFTANAADIAVEASSEPVLEESLPEAIAPEQEVVVENAALVSQSKPQTTATQKAKKVRKSVIKKGAGAKRVGGKNCQQYLDLATTNKTNILDLTRASDFEQNGLSTIQSFLSTVKETSSFNTHSKNISIDLTETGVSAETVSLILEQAKNEEYNLILNLSFNKSIGDELLDFVGSFQNIYSIFLRDTNISDVGISKICAILDTAGIGNLHMIDISGTHVTQNGIKTLAEKIKSAWEAQNPEGQYPGNILICSLKKQGKQSQSKNIKARRVKKQGQVAQSEAFSVQQDVQGDSSIVQQDVETEQQSKTLVVAPSGPVDTGDSPETESTAALLPAEAQAVVSENPVTTDAVVQEIVPEPSVASEIEQVDEGAEIVG